MHDLHARVTIAAAAMMAAAAAGAFEVGVGEVTGSWDTTVSFGTSWRTQDPAASAVGLANGGSAFTVNADDGDLNYRSGSFSRLAKLTTEIDLTWRNFGLFARGTGFKDIANENAGDRTPLTHQADFLVTSNVELLDAFAWGRFDLGGMPLEVRAGEQVVSWGESTFIPNSINVINPFDVTKLRTPGSELKEALKPVGMVWASLGVTENVSLEGYYAYDYERTRIDPLGSYFSTTDVASDGAQRLFLFFGDVSDLGTVVPGPATLPFPFGLAAAPGAPGGLDPAFGAVQRTGDRRADNGGEYGVALRVFAPKLNDTEFGLYFINYHSRLPVLNAVTAGPGDIGNAIGAAAAAGAVGLGLAPPVAAGAGAGAGLLFGASNAAVAAAVGANCAFASGLAQGLVVPGVTFPISTLAPGFAGPAAALPGECILDQYAKGARYFLEYPRDIKLFGVSFNTVLGTTGWALQGEYSYRMDAPLQIDVQELIFAAATPLAAAGDVAVAGGVFPANPFAAFRLNQVTGGADVAPGTVVRGFIERDVSQVQMTATRLFGPMLGANQFALVGEFAVMHVHDMPDKNVLRLEAPGTATTGNPFHAGPTGLHAGKPAIASRHYPDPTSAGYQIRGQLEYDNALGPVNLLPHFAWAHDVAGVSPGPGGPFLAGRKALTVGLTMTYLSNWRGDVSYTNFFGAGKFNPLRDRDFVAMSLQYSF